ncbi:hypothetical protein HOP50_03g21640 [Chloropicon primus]|uniref:WD40 repeat domain-containing protein n=2 Tax=Chloropicon primus TaxID=1764295 RepID=A0A5B8MGR9_9CHLO|nr:hypothetical protein A3770_03p21640 [Chloropicon primus]UPQ98858.1 hypothetical protein HOP50_03g21640 [Chloropicon primus]|eukprot:QDZ19646.1 hypothetical protein A3770_03p21640 [Chloropicon primus]
MADEEEIEVLSEEEIEVLSGSEEASGPIVTRSATQNTRQTPSQQVQDAVSEFVAGFMGDMLSYEEEDAEDTGTEEDEDLVWDEENDSDDSFLYSEEEEWAWWAELEGDLSTVLQTPAVVERVWGSNPPSFEEQQEEVYAYYTLLKQAHQTDESLSERGTSKRLLGGDSCCVLDSGKGEAIVFGDGDASGTTRHINSSYDHCQVADSIICNCYDGVNDEIVVVKKRMMHLYTVSRTSTVARKDADVYLGINPYTIARSANGECIVVGGDLHAMLFHYNREKRELKYSSILVFQRNQASEFPMANYATFGKVGGKERLLLTNQNGNIYIFEVPSRGEIEERQAQGEDPSPLFMCTTFYDNVWNPPQISNSRLESQVMTVGSSSVQSWIQTVNSSPNRAPNAFEVYVSLSSAQKELRTNVVGKFPIALNCAVPSADSKWLAVVGDSQMVFVCPLDKIIQGHIMKYKATSTEVYMPYVVRLKLPGGKALAHKLQHRPVARPYSQYCVWNDSSTLLAASSDNGNYVAVWSSSNWSLVKVFEYKKQGPCLSLRFVDGLDSSLLWAEDISESVSVGNVYCPKKKDRTFLKLPDRMDRRKRKRLSQAFNNFGGGMTKDIPPILGQRITGIGCTTGGNRTYVYTASTSQLSRHEVLRSWSPETHSKFTSKKFKKALLQVLLGARSSATLRLLPEPVLLKILSLAAFPAEAWA